MKMVKKCNFLTKEMRNKDADNNNNYKTMTTTTTSTIMTMLHQLNSNTHP